MLILARGFCAAGTDGYIVETLEVNGHLSLFRTRGKLSHSQMLPKICNQWKPCACSTKISFVPDLFFGILNWIGTVVDYEQSLCDGNTIHPRIWLSAVHRQLVPKPQSPRWICDFSEGKVNMCSLTSQMLLKRPFLVYYRLIEYFLKCAFR